MSSGLRNQRLCAWSGVAMIVVMLVGFEIAGFNPPPSPHDSALQIAALFRDHTTPIRIGLVLTMFGSALLGPFVAAVESIETLSARLGALREELRGAGALTPNAQGVRAAPGAQRR
jgi:hypothetical protein